MATEITSQLDFVLFYVSNLEASLAYFTEQLGMKRLPEQSTEDFHMFTGSNGFSFGINRASEQTPVAGSIEVYFKSSDFRSLHSQLVEQTKGTGEIIQMPFGTIFNTRTPDGTKIVVME